MYHLLDCMAWTLESKYAGDLNFSKCCLAAQTGHTFTCTECHPEQTAYKARSSPLAKTWRDSCLFMLNIVSGALNSVFSLSSRMILRLFLGFCSSCALIYTHRRFTTWHAQASSSVVLGPQAAAQRPQEATAHALTSVRGMLFSPRKT